MAAHGCSFGIFWRNTYPNLKMRSTSLLLLASALFSIGSCSNTGNGFSQSLPSPGSFQRTGEIALGLSTDKLIYKDGDPIRITVSTSDTCHLRVFTLDADGKLSQLWPNKVSSDRVLKAAETIILGSPANGFILKARKPYGREMIWSIASTEPFPSGYLPVTRNSSPWDTSARGMALAAETISAKHWGEAKRVVEIIQ